MGSEPFIRLSPVFKDYLWGGKRLKPLCGAGGGQAAEAWLLSAHPDGESTIAEGNFQGTAFSQYLRARGQTGPFPILVKLIDAAQTLSVQVHPGDAYARVHENDNGKNELWLVLESAPGAYLYVGFQRDVTREEVARRVTDGTIEEVLHKVPTHAGDAVFIPAGTVHAIGAGNLILEIQQSSNATYRLYDYKRPGADGKLRPLHLDKALDVLDYRAYAGAAGGPKPETGELARCPYFNVFRYALHGEPFALPVPAGSFASVVCIGGTGTLLRGGAQTALRTADSLYLPAGEAQTEIRGDLQIVVTCAAP